MPTDDPKTLSLDELTNLADAASQRAREDAAAVGRALPVWRDGHVVHEDPNTGQILDAGAEDEAIVEEIESIGDEPKVDVHLADT